ncbi:lipopolysaccharide biosynthesis protein [Clostridium perfringens]|uniref:lipopolysaccharide biosynthesis protein n=1 Tax=Clostridium perfringens TaxID=1502 RepID=UPI0039E72C78
MNKYLCNIILKYKSISTPVKSAIWFTFGNFLNLGISIITMPIFTRILSAADIGQVSVYNTWQGILSIIVTLNLAYGVYEVSLVKYKEDQNNMTASLVMITLILGSFFVILISFFNGIFCEVLGLESKYIYIMCFDIIFASIITFWITQNRFKYNYKPCVILLSSLAILRAIISILFVIIFNNDKSFSRIIGYAIPDYILGFCLMISMLRKGNKWFEIEYWQYAIKFNIVLIPHYLSGVLLSSSDKIMISKIINDDKAGIYSIAYTCASLITILFTSINSVFTPYIYNSLKNKNYLELRENTNRLIIITIGFAFTLILLAPEAIKIFAPPNYLEGIWLIPPITVGIYMTFLYSLFSSIEFYYEKNKFITIATITGSIINIVLNIIFIPIFGYVAAAYTTLIGYLIMAVGHYIFYKSIIPEKIYDIISISKYIIIFIILSGVTLILYPFTIIRCIVIFIILLLIFYKRKYILSILSLRSEKK